jgi:hypothetical protein
MEMGEIGRRTVDGNGDAASTGAPDEAAHFRRITLGTAAAGAAFVVLFVVSVSILAQAPGPRASDEAIVQYYSGADRRWLSIVGLYLLPLAAVAFLWFIAALREWVSGSSRRLNQVLSNVQLLSGIAFIALSLTASAATVVGAFEVEFGHGVLDPAAARQFPLFGSALFYVFAMRMAAIFVTSTTGIVRGSGIFPRWFQVVSYVVAACLFLVPSRGLWLTFVFPAWVLLLSALIVFRRKSIASFAGVAEAGTADRAQ